MRSDGGATPVPPLEGGDGPPGPAALKREHRRFYDGITERLDASPYGVYSYFLNLGYMDDGSPRSGQIPLPARYPNRTSAELVSEVIADCPLAGRHVLDVGCGRGGTVALLKQFSRPASLTGVDLSPAAAAFDQRTHGTAGVRFCAGDAEQLPFRSGIFDVVVNLESSHSYPSLASFYREVHRVLGPAGDFLYADLLPLDTVTTAIRLLDSAGFELVRCRDITRNVLLSCDQVAERRLTALGADQQASLRNFLATPGSAPYERMASGAYSFRILTLRKRS